MYENEFDIRSTIGTLKRQAWAIIIALVVAVGIAATVAFSLDPVYRATTVVMVDTSNKNLLDPTVGSSSSASADNARMESEVSVVKSEANVEMVLRTAGLLDDPDFRPREGLRRQVLVMLGLATPPQYTAIEQQQAAAGILYGATSVERQGQTYLLSISANASTPDKAALIANTLAEVYIRNQVESKVNRVLAGRDMMFDRLNETRADLVETEQAFSDFVLDSATEVAKATGRSDIEQLRLDLEATAFERDRLAEQFDLVQSGLAQNDWAQVANTLENQSLTSLRERQREIEQEISTLADGSPQLQQLRLELIALIERFRAEATVELEALQSQVSDQRAREADIQLQLRSSILTTNLPPEVLARMYELQQNAEISRSQYEQLLVRLREIEGQAFLQVADSRVVSKATPPSRPSSPNIPFMVFTGLLVGLGVGVGLAFLREHFVGGINSAEQLSAVTGMPVVATVPLLRNFGQAANGKKIQTLPAVVNERPYSSFSEAIRRIRVSIDMSLRRLRRGTEGAAVIMVSSANANEGKTTIALSLARVYAMSNQSTLLIDGDLRWPNIHKEVGIPPSPALNDYLQAEQWGDLDGIMLSDPVSSAKIIVGSDPAEARKRPAVSSEMLSNLIEEALTRFDVVIVDTPPVGAVVDALYLAQHADAILNVTKYGTTSQQEVRATLRELVNSKREEADIFCMLNAHPQSKAENKRRFRNYYDE